MASTRNPLKPGNRKLTAINLNYSIPSFCNSEFNPQTPVAKKPSDFHGRNPSLSNFIPMISDIAANDNDTTAIFYGFDFPCFWVLGGSGMSSALLVRRFPRSVKASPFKKLADFEPGSGSDVLSQIGKMTIHGDSADSGEGGIDGGSGSGNNDGNGRGSGGDGEGDGDSNGGSGDAGAGDNIRWWKVWIKRIKVHGLALYNDGSIHRSPVIDSDAFAYQYNSWHEIGAAMLQFWLDKNNYNLDRLPEIPDGNPNFCCPGGVTLFGRYEGGVFYGFRWQVHDWNAVKLLISDIIVIRFVEGNWRQVN